MPKRVITEAAAAPAADQITERGTVPIVLISPGWGSSGYYSAQVLEAAVNGIVFPAGTKMFMDHPGEAESYDRPERSIRDLIGVLESDARWDPKQGVIGEAKVFDQYCGMFRDPDFVDAIGVSIRAYADTRIGEAEGRKGTIITDLVEAVSVDYVTTPGRGGKVLAVLESARSDTRVMEAVQSEQREIIDTAIRETYGDEQTWVWLRDFDPEAGLVWFTVETADGGIAIYQQGYTFDAATMTATLTDGDPIEVRARTEYVPVTQDPSPTAPSESGGPAPAGQSTTTQESKEDTMPQIEEARLRQLEEDAGRVATLEAERDTAARERDEAVTRLAAHEARESARPAVTRALAESGLTQRRQARLAESILSSVTPDTTPESLAETAAAVIADEQADIAELAEAMGFGRVRGFGAQVGESGGGYTVDDFDAAFNTKEA